MGYINPDKFTIAGMAKVNLKVDGTGSTIDYKNLFAYYILDDALSVVPFTASYADNEFKGAYMLQQRTHIVACTIYKGEFYAGTLNNITQLMLHLTP